MNKHFLFCRDSLINTIVDYDKSDSEEESAPTEQMFTEPTIQDMALTEPPTQESTTTDPTIEDLVTFIN